MSDPSYELQDTIVRTLKGGGSPPAISAIGSRVYDVVPTVAVFPYVTLGPAQVLPDKAECIDGAEVFPQIDIWSRSVGFGEVKLIVKQVLLLLDDQPLTVSGFNLVLFEITNVNYLVDPDGLTRHAAMTFHGILTPT